MEFFIIGAIIGIILRISFGKKKKIEKQKREDAKKEAIFAEVVKGFVDSYEGVNKNDIFREIYDTFMGNAISAEKDKLLEKVPTLKIKYKKAVRDLVTISENNTVLFSTDEEVKKFEAEVDFFKREQKYTDDIIKTLPYLAQFIEIHKILVLNIFNGYLNKITAMYQYLWQGFSEVDYEKEENEFIRNGMKERFESSCKMALDAYRFYIEDLGWDVICKNYPQYNTESNKKQFEQIAENDDESYFKWVEIWQKKLQDIAISDGYGPMFSELYNFFNDVNAEFGNPAWLKYPSSKFSLSLYSSFGFLDMDEFDTEESYRIRNLYISGKMSGIYYQVSDPKYARKRKEN